MSVVGGGDQNLVSAYAGTVGGGALNVVNVNGGYAVVGGGVGNTAGGSASSVVGGSQNTASGFASTVGGGYLNVASGAYSFAAGTRAMASTSGCFAFGDNSTGNVVSCGSPNEFIVRALGGIFMFAGGASDATYTGAYLPPGGTAWTVYSDRNGKDNLRAVDAQEVLHKLASIPILTWNWKSQDAAIRHMGSIAQDFKRAFDLGETETGISTVDADGVAFAAIQGLNFKVESSVSAIDGLRARIAGQQRALAAQGAEIASLRQQAAKFKLDRAAQSAQIAELRQAVEALLVRSPGDGKLAATR